MEQNMDDSPPVTPKVRRRSSFFERRTSAIMPLIPDLAKQEEELKQKNIELYMELLTKENKSWEDWYKAKRSAYKESKRRSMCDPTPAPLLPEHLAFLSMRPALPRLVEDMAALTGSVGNLLAMQRRREAAWLRVVEAHLERDRPMLEAILERSRLTWQEE